MTSFFGFIALAQEGGREGNIMQTLIMIGIAVVFFYFILWRPEKKRRKKMEEQKASMKKGDRATVMGMIGTIAQIKDTTVMLQVDGAKIEVLKAAITDVQPAGSNVEVEEAPKS